MKKTALFHNEKCLWHSTPGLYVLAKPVGGWVQPPSGAGLAESPDTKRRIVSLLEVSKLRKEIDIVDAPPCTEEDLLRVHPKSYLDAFKKLSDERGGELGPHAPFGKGGYEIARLSAGLAKHAMESVIEKRYKNAYSISRPPGHHCLSDTPMGFCMLANVAIGVEHVLHTYNTIKKVAIIDWDVHHGNGTQEIFYHRKDVLTISMHQDGCFPPGYSGENDLGKGDGFGYNTNIPILPGAGHEAYLYAMKNIVIPKVEKFKPDLIVVASGLDANAVDPLARMLAYGDTFREMTKMLMATANEYCEDRLVLVHEGGYSEAMVPFCAHAIFEALTGIKSDVSDPDTASYIGWQPSKEFNEFHIAHLNNIAKKVL